MKHTSHLLCMALAAALLGGCASSTAPTAAAAPSESPAAVASSPAAAPTEETLPEELPTPTPEPETAPAETAGERVYTLDSDYMVLDADQDSGWFVVSWLSKGYGTQWLAINPALDQQIEGEEGAEVLLCGDNILQFAWCDASGGRVPAYDMFYYDGSDPQEMTLCATLYDLQGNLQEEREVLKMTQSADDPYYSTAYPAMEALANELGGSLSVGSEMLSAVDDGGDAVVMDAGGHELLRLPACDATMTYAFSTADGSHVSVYRPDSDSTEIYRF